jgi:hypothetical protein
MNSTSEKATEKQIAYINDLLTQYQERCAERLRSAESCGDGNTKTANTYRSALRLTIPVDLDKTTSSKIVDALKGSFSMLPLAYQKLVNLGLEEK